MKSSQGPPNGFNPEHIRRVLSYLLRKIDKRPFVLIDPPGMKNHHSLKESIAANPPKVSIIIPTRDKSDLLSKCVDSIKSNTKYPNYEIVIVNNLSSEQDTLTLLKSCRDEGISVLDFAQPFNYSKICNLAADTASGQILCFLNNDTEVLSENWLSSMVEHAIHDEIGVVGAVLTYPDGSIQHMGIALGYTGIAGHPGRGNSPAETLPNRCYEVSGVTFACALVSKKKFQEIGGLDENYPFGFNDVDLCLRSTSAGYKNIVCLDARLTHSESQTRKRTFTITGALQAAKDVLFFLSRNQTNLEERFFSVKASE
jgi:O-antigen biosynthesis protein